MRRSQNCEGCQLCPHVCDPEGAKAVSAIHLGMLMPLPASPRRAPAERVDATANPHLPGGGCGPAVKRSRNDCRPVLLSKYSTSELRWQNEDYIQNSGGIGVCCMQLPGSQPRALVGIKEGNASKGMMCVRQEPVSPITLSAWPPATG